MLTSSAVVATLFFGGWQGPFVSQFPLLGLVYLALKIIFVLFLFVWVRASMPRIRYDHLMQFGWKYLLPLSLVYLAVTAVLVVMFG